MTADAEPNHKSGDGLVPISVVNKELGLSQTRIRQLVEDGLLPQAPRTAGGHRRFDLAGVRDAWARRQLDATPGVATGTEGVWAYTYPLAGGNEEDVWREMDAKVGLEGPARSAAHYVVTEMVNNAIDHSQGTHVTVAVGRDVAGHVVIDILDDGEGAFRHLAAGLELDGDLAALGELTKGKRTTDPAHHTGEGIFFSSKAVETFSIAANGLRLSFDNVRDDFAAGSSDVNAGTLVHAVVDPDTTNTMPELFAAWTDDTVFNRTRPRVKLFELGVAFVSRSEAKRIAANLEAFEKVELDFTGVTEVGQGFADELLRVWANNHPGTTLHPTNMNEPVAFMVRRALGTS
jgi:hypothetical protein